MKKKLSSSCIDCVFKKFYIVDKEEMSDLSKEKMEIVKIWGLQRQMKES